MRSAVVVTGPLSSGYYSLGDVTSERELSHMTTKPTSTFYFLSNIDIHTSEENRAIICYGDSITAQDWPDLLTKRMIASGISHTAVIRRATSGSRILRQYECITYNSYGLKATNRFHHELPASGADTVIIQQGVNDIIHPVGTDVNEFRPMSDLPTVSELTDGLKWYVDEAHKMGLKAYLGTLLPIEGWRTYAPFREELRAAANDWMRHFDGADGCIDFDAVLCDTKNPTALTKEYDSGDHLHPSKEGYRLMADTVPDILLK
jgi:lysophospholipase L1-like esterase